MNLRAFFIGQVMIVVGAFAFAVVNAAPEGPSENALRIEAARRKMGEPRIAQADSITKDDLKPILKQLEELQQKVDKPAPEVFADPAPAPNAQPLTLKVVVPEKVSLGDICPVQVQVNGAPMKNSLFAFDPPIPESNLAYNKDGTFKGFVSPTPGYYSMHAIGVDAAYNLAEASATTELVSADVPNSVSTKRATRPRTAEEVELDPEIAFRRRVQEVKSPNKEFERLALAQIFRRGESFDACNAAGRIAVKDNLAAWMPFFKEVNERFERARSEGKFSKPGAERGGLKRVALALEEVQ